jgi:uncharacterized membrane protein YoaK (UPF0700 family)
MLIQEGDSRTSRIDVSLAAILSFVAGTVNSAGYFAFGSFSANMTGNVSLISDHISLGQLAAAAAFASIVLLFILGAFLASLFIQLGKHRNWRRVYPLTLLAEVCLLLIVGALDIHGSGPLKGTLIVGILSFTMGIQNAASTRISRGRVRTTHVSGVATDIGVGLATLWRSKNSEAHSATLRRLKLHSATILSFLAGGIAGVLSYRFAQGAIFWAAAVPLFLLCAKYLRRPAAPSGSIV